MKLFVLSHHEARNRAIQAIKDAPDGYVVKITQQTRSSDQNAAMWAALHDISKQVVWHGRKLPPESWKNIFSAALQKQEVVPNIDGTGFVVLGQETSRFTKAQMSDMIELIHAFGVEHGAVFSN